MIGLEQLADVYVPDGTTGAYTELAKAGLRCRLAHVAQIFQAPGGERAEVAGNRRLLWDEDYEMPEEAQVEIEGLRWNVRPGTAAQPLGPGGRAIYRRVEVVEA